MRKYGTIPGQLSLFDYMGISPASEKKPGKRKSVKGDILSPFAKKYDKKMLEDWGATMSTDAKSFYRSFRNYLKREFPEAELTGFKPNHYDFSGFLTINGRSIYVSHSLNRVGTEAVADFSDRSCMNGVLYRTAESTKDFRGGHNHFTSINELAKELRTMFEKYELFARAA